MFESIKVGTIFERPCGCRIKIMQEDDYDYKMKTILNKCNEEYKHVNGWVQKRSLIRVLEYMNYKIYNDKFEKRKERMCSM